MNNSSDSKLFNNKDKLSKTSGTNLDSNNIIEKKVLRYKVILIGDTAVGKTSILQRFINNKFKLEYNCTIGVDYWVKSLSLNNENIIDLQIWDTCGQERFRTVTRQYYKNTHGKIHLYSGCLLVFDLSKKETFSSLEVWLEDTRNFGNHEMVMVIVGNKSDLTEMREVSRDEINQLVQKYNFCYIEVSALTGENVKSCFETISNLMLILENEIDQNNSKQSKKKFKVDNRNVTLNNGVDLTNRQYTSPNNGNCC